MSEHSEQVALFEWAAYMVNQGIDALAYMHAIPNGGHRRKTVALKLAREGVRPGVPDIFFPYPSQGHHGLYIEMKVGKNKPTAHQKRFMAYLKEAGYRVEVCYGWEAARQIIVEYMGLEEQDDYAYL